MAAPKWQDQPARDLALTPRSERGRNGDFFPMEGLDSRAGSSKIRPAPKNPKGTWESAETTPELLNPENWQRRSRPRGRIKRVGTGTAKAQRTGLVADDMSVNPDPSALGDNLSNPGITESGMAGASASAGRARQNRKR